MKRALLGTTALLVPGIASAHPDHLSGGNFGLVHLLSDPFHLGLAAAAVLLAVASWRSLRRRQAVRQHDR